MKIPFHKAFLSEEEAKAVSEVIASGWITMGQKTFDFEEKFAEYLSAKHAVALNSCTAALHLSLAAAELKAGDEVIIPSTTFISTWEAVKYFGAKPVLADVDVKNHLILPGEIEKKASSRTKAVIPVHYSGHPCEMDAIMDIAEKNDFAVIDDAAHAFPSKYHDKYVGTLAHASCFSFYATKTLTTGEGGMVTTANEEWAERIKRLRLHGISKNAWNRYSDKGTWQYDVTEPGFKYNTNDMASAMGLVQLGKTDFMQSRREEIAARYTKAFSESDLIEPYIEKPDCKSSWHLYTPKLNIEKLNMTRNEFLVKLNEIGIGMSVHFIPLYKFSCMKEEGGTDPQSYPNSEYIFERVFSLPIYPSLKDEEIDYIIYSVLTILKENQR